jgi:hypothetical protein
MSKSPVLLELDFPSHRYSEVGSCCSPSAWASFENPYADKPKMHTPSRRRILCINFSTGVMVVGGHLSACRSCMAYTSLILRRATLVIAMNIFWFNTSENIIISIRVRVTPSRKSLSLLFLSQRFCFLS